MEMPNENVKEQCRNALKTYMSRRSPSMVKNPVLLLNYLHQRSLISRPVYNVYEKESPNYFEVWCSVDKCTTVGMGHSKKAAKNNAAQTFITLLYSDNVHDEIEQKIQDLTVSPMEFHQYHTTVPFYEDDISNIYSFENDNELSKMICVEPQRSYNGDIVTTSPHSVVFEQETSFKENINMFTSPLPNQCRSFKNKDQSSSITYADPQGDFSNIIVSGPRCNTIPTTGSMLTRENNISVVTEPDQNKSFNQLPGKVIAHEDYFDPFKKLKFCNEQESKKIVGHNQTNSNKLTNKPKQAAASSDQKTLQNGCVSVAAKNRSNTEACVINTPAKFPENNSDEIVLCLADYFDPFLKIKSDRINAKENVISKSDVKEDIISKFHEPELGDSGSSRAESEIGDNIYSSHQPFDSKKPISKSPFALLYEKAYNQFRLVPRCTIEDCENGFKCRLVVDSLTSFGEGSSKRQAKMNAAVDMLRQMEQQS